MESNSFDVLTGVTADPTIGQTDATPDEDGLLTERLMTFYRPISQDWRDQLIEDWDFFLGAQTPQKQDQVNKQNRTPKTYNVDVIFQAVEQAIALLTSNRPRFTATGTEDSDTRIAQVFAYIMQFLWYINMGTAKLKQVIKDYYVGSIGWMLVYWDPLANNDNGEICLETIDPKRVFVDPNARGFFYQDAAHMIIETDLTPEMMQDRYNMTVEELQNYEKSFPYIQSSTRVSETHSGSSFTPIAPYATYKRFDRYSRVKIMMWIISKDDERFEMVIPIDQFKKKISQMPVMISRSNNVTNYFVSPRNVAEVSKLLQQYGEVFHEIQDQQGNTQLISGAEGQVSYPPGFTAVPNSTTYLQLSTMYDAIRKGKVEARRGLIPRIKHIVNIGRKTLYTNIEPTEFHTLVPLINNFDRTIYPVGDVRRVKREQEFINSIRQIVVTHAAVTTNFKIGYPEGRYNEKKLADIYNDPAKRFIPYDAEMQSAGLQILAPPPLPNHLYQLEQQARKNIEERLGIFALMQGSPQDAPSTYKGTVALDEYGQRRIKSKKDDIEEFLNQLGKIVVDFVQYYYTDTRAINIVTPNDKPMTITLKNDSSFDNLMGDNEYRLNDITTGRFDIMVISGSTLPSNRFALLETYMELFKIGLLDQETVLQKTEVANVEQVMERIGMIKQLQQQLAQAQEQIKNLSGDMQTKDRELMHAKQDKAQTIFQKNLEKEEIKATAARMIYENTLKNLRKSVTH